MGILHVVHRVLVGAFLRQVNIEHKLGIGLARDQEKPHRVAPAHHIAVARHLDQITQGDVGAGPLGNLDFLAALHHRHHLVQHVVGPGRRNTQVLMRADRLQPGAHARDGAVVVRALHVDCLGETTLPFAQVIRHVGHKIGVAAVRLFHHAVFVVAVAGGLEPQRATVFKSFAGCGERAHSGLHLAILIQR